MAAKLVQVRIETKAQLKELEKFNNVISVTDEKITQAAVAQERMRKGTDKMTGESKLNGRAILEVSRAWEDLQYGISGVLNNVPGILQALGKSAGAAGVVSLALVTANAAWQLFNRRTKEASTNLDQLTTDLDEFARKTDESIGDSTKKWNDYTQAVDDAARIDAVRLGVTEDAISAEENLLRVTAERNKLLGIASARETDKIEFDSKRREIESKALANLPADGRALDDLREIQQRNFGEMTARQGEAEEAIKNAKELIRVRDEELKRLKEIAELDKQLAAGGLGPALREQKVNERRGLLNNAPENFNLEAQNKRIDSAVGIAGKRGEALQSAIAAFDQGEIDIAAEIEAEKALAVEKKKRTAALIELENARLLRAEQRDKEETAAANKIKALEDKANEAYFKGLLNQLDALVAADKANKTAASRSAAEREKNLESAAGLITGGGDLFTDDFKRVTGEAYAVLSTSGVGAPGNANAQNTAFSQLLKVVENMSSQLKSNSLSADDRLRLNKLESLYNQVNFTK